MSAVTSELIPALRLDLVPLRAEHADEMATVLADPELYIFTGGSPPTLQELRARYERWTAGSPDPAESWCNWVIQLHSPRCLAGTVQATISTSGRPAAEVAWVVGTRGNGEASPPKPPAHSSPGSASNPSRPSSPTSTPTTTPPPPSLPQPGSPPPASCTTEK